MARFRLRLPHGRRLRLRDRFRLALIAAACCLSLSASSLSQALPAAAKPSHLGVGLTVGKVGFIGTYAVNGRPTFCIDLNGQGPSTASGYTASQGHPILKQLGWTTDHKGGTASSIRGPALTAAELGQLAYLLDHYAATRSATTAVAAEHVVRLLTVGDKAQADREAVRWRAAVAARPAVRATFDAMAKDVRAKAGPYAVTATWATTPTAQADGALTVTVLSQAGSGMAGITLHGTTTAGDGSVQPWTSHTDAQGAAAVPIPVTAKGSLSLAVIAVGLPASAPILYTPKHYGSAKSPDNVAQRTVGAAPRVSVSASVTATVGSVVPTVTTAAGPATPTSGDSLTDDITLTGAARGYQGTATASLWGPFDKAPTAKSCASPATPAETTTVDVSGDGTVTTPGLPVTTPGYYTWSIDLPAAGLQDAVSTACGDKTETVFVTAAPVLTLATAGPPQPGQPATATVSISGMYPNYSPKAALTLYGPFLTTPTVTDCTSKTKALTSTVTLAGDGDYPTKPFTLPFSGYYTWAVSVPGNSTEPAITLDCGADDRTFLVVRDDIGALNLSQTATGGSTAPDSTAAAKTAKLTITTGPVNAPLVSAKGLLGGIDVPPNIALSAQFDQGAHVGDLLGAIVIAGRPSDANATPGAMANLSKVNVGDAVTLVDVNGKTGKFVVDSVTTLPRTQSIPANLLAQGNPLSLVILSTIDATLYGAGLTTYRTHLIVTATPA